MKCKLKNFSLKVILLILMCSIVLSNKWVKENLNEDGEGSRTCLPSVKRYFNRLQHIDISLMKNVFDLRITFPNYWFKYKDFHKSFKLGFTDQIVDLIENINFRCPKLLAIVVLGPQSKVHEQSLFKWDSHDSCTNTLSFVMSFISQDLSSPPPGSNDYSQSSKGVYAKWFKTFAVIPLSSRIESITALDKCTMFYKTLRKNLKRRR